MWAKVTIKCSVRIVEECTEVTCYDRYITIAVRLWKQYLCEAFCWALSTDFGYTCTL